MSKPICEPQISSSQGIQPNRRRFLVSCFIIFHLFALGLTYATNWRRSELQDGVLVWLYPYLIGGSWYQESIPVEWISDTAMSKKISVSMLTNSEPDHWIEILDSGSLVTSFEGARKDRLKYLLAELASNEDSDGLTRIFKSMVSHIEKTMNGNKVAKIRLTRLSIAGEGERDDAVLFEASVTRFEGGEFGFVPKTESHRSVRSTWDEVNP